MLIGINSFCAFFVNCGDISIYVVMQLLTGFNVFFRTGEMIGNTELTNSSGEKKSDTK